MADSGIGYGGAAAAGAIADLQCLGSVRHFHPLGLPGAAAHAERGVVADIDRDLIQGGGAAGCAEHAVHRGFDKCQTGVFDAASCDRQVIHQSCFMDIKGADIRREYTAPEIGRFAALKRASGGDVQAHVGPARSGVVQVVVRGEIGVVVIEMQLGTRSGRGK